MQLSQITKRYYDDFCIKNNHYVYYADYIEITETFLLNEHRIYIRFYEAGYDGNKDTQIGEKIKINEEEYNEIINNANFDFLPYIKQAYENEIKEYEQKIKRTKQKIEEIKRD